MRRKITIATLLAALAFVWAAPSWGKDEAAPELQALKSIDDLAQAFNADAGAPRVVLLLSPT